MKVITTVQITIDITHDDDLPPSEVTRLAGNLACDAITWTDESRLFRATEGVNVPVEVTNSTVTATRPYETGT